MVERGGQAARRPVFRSRAGRGHAAPGVRRRPRRSSGSRVPRLRRGGQRALCDRGRRRAGDPSFRTRFGLPQRFFLASNRFLPKKNLPGLLRAFAQYRTAAGADPWDLVLLGDGPLRPDVERLIADIGLAGAVHLPGFKQYPELPAYYGLAGAFVHASTSEQWGLVVNEAMAAGLPVLVSDRCGCAPDLVAEGINGFTFPPEDHVRLAGLMSEVAAQPDRRGNGSSEPGPHCTVGAGTVCRRILGGGGRSDCGTGRNAGHAGQMHPEVTVIGTLSTTRRTLVHVIESVSGAAGGPPLSTSRLALAMAAIGYRVQILAEDPDAPDAVTRDLRKFPIIKIPRPNLLEWLHRGSARAHLAVYLEGANFIYLHGVWDPLLLAAGAEARAAGIPYVVNPHGMLDPWSLAQKRWKKRLALALVVRRFLNGARQSERSTATRPS